MKAQAAAFEGEPPHVSLMFNAQETQELADDLDRCAALLDDEEGGPPAAQRAARVRLLVQVLRHELGHLEQASLANRGTWPKVTADVAINQVILDAVLPPLDKIKAANAKAIPAEHVEWALKVYRMDSRGRATNPTLERVFAKGEPEAREYFVRTQNVWNMRVRAGEAQAFDVVLGIQDARKHKKKGSFTEIEVAQCTGTVA